MLTFFELSLFVLDTLKHNIFIPQLCQLMATQLNTLSMLEFCHVCTSFASRGPEKGASSENVWAFSFPCLFLFFYFSLFFVFLNYFVHFYFLWGSWFWVTGKQLSAAEIRWCSHFRFLVLESWPCCGCLKSRETTKGSIKYLLHEAKKLALINAIGSLLYLFHTVRGYRSTNIVTS